MEKIRISKYQLYSIMVLFGLGSASVLGVAKDAKQDAWIALLFSCGIGILLFLIFGFIFSQYPDLTFTEIIEKTFGKFFSKPIILVYALFFLYIAARNLRDYTELISLYVLGGTPMFILALFTMFVILYTIHSGLENIARSSEIYFVFILMIILSFTIFILFSGVTDVNNLLPILENGFKPIIKSSSVLLAFPYGELIVFFMILRHVNKKKGVLKVGILAILTFSFLLLVLTILNILTLSPLLVEQTHFPTILTIEMINIGDFIQRLDALAVLMFTIGTYTKIILFQYVAVTALMELFKPQKPIVIESSTSAIILVASLLIANSLTQHLHIGLNVTLYSLNYPFEIIFPILLALILFVKLLFKRLRNKNHTTNKTEYSQK